MAYYDYTCKNASCRSNQFEILENGKWRCVFCGRIYDEAELKEHQETLAKEAKEIADYVHARWDDALNRESFADRIQGFEAVIADLKGQLAAQGARLSTPGLRADEAQALAHERMATLQKLAEAMGVINDLEAQYAVSKPSGIDAINDPITIERALANADESRIATFMYPAIGIRNLVEYNLTHNADKYGYKYGTVSLPDKTGVLRKYDRKFYVVLPDGTVSLLKNKAEKFKRALQYWFPNLEFAAKYYPKKAGDLKVDQAVQYMNDIHALAHNTDESQLQELQARVHGQGMTMKAYLTMVWHWFNENHLGGVER